LALFRAKFVDLGKKGNYIVRVKKKKEKKEEKFPIRVSWWRGEKFAFFALRGLNPLQKRKKGQDTFLP
jgi:hypothetical protein